MKLSLVLRGFGFIFRSFLITSKRSLYVNTTLNNLSKKICCYINLILISFYILIYFILKNFTSKFYDFQLTVTYHIRDIREVLKCDNV